MDTKKCIVCGSDLGDCAPTKKFCSRSCKTKHEYAARKTAKATCLYCGAEYMTNPAQPAKFCSYSCGTKYGNEQDKPVKTLTCIDCGATFEFIGRTTKKRCDDCKRKFKSQRVMILRAAKDPSVHLGVGSGGAQTPTQLAKKLNGEPPDPEHEAALAKRRVKYREDRERLEQSPTGTVSYRDLVLTGKDKCAICGFYALQAALEVHHKDFDRSHNEVDNLEILCANCHTVLHKEAVGPVFRSLYQELSVAEFHPLLVQTVRDRYGKALHRVEQPELF